MTGTFKDKPLDERKSLVRAMIERMARAYGVNKKALSQHLDCNRNVINNWVYYGRIPYEQLDTCHRVTGVSLDWLMYGYECSQIPQHAESEEIKSIVEHALKCGVELDLIDSNYHNAIDQLSHKITQDLHQQFDIKKR